MSLFNPFSWFTSETVEQAPAKTVSVIHAMLAAIEEHEAGHPLLLKMTQWLDDLIASKGEALIQSVETAVLAALKAKYPMLGQ